MTNKKFYYNFIHQKLLASLFISKEKISSLAFLFFVKQLNLTINTIKLYDINLLTINALWFLMFGQYPHIIFKKKLAKYRKSKITFMISFTKQNVCYNLFKLLYLSSARQIEFKGYIYKTIFFIAPQPHFNFPLQTINIFYMAEYLYSQQIKSILTVKQNVTINVDCSFKEKNNFANLDYLRIMNVPLNFDEHVVFDNLEVEPIIVKETV
jgi:hypothetical protein